MAVVALTDAFVYVHAHDFTGDSNNALLTMDVVDLESSTFNSNGWKEVAAGPKSSKFDLKGFWQSAASDSVDSDSFPDLGVVDRVLTVGDIETEGQVAYLAQLGKFHYQLGGPYGGLAPFTLGCAGTDGVGVVRGQLAKARGNVSATGQLGSIVNLGAPGATQFVYCTVHVMTAGTTITLQLQSDDNAPFASPTTRATIGPLTTVGGTWMTRLAGPFAGETFWRLNVSAITGTFNIAGAIAIQ